MKKDIMRKMGSSALLFLSLAVVQFLIACITVLTMAVVSALDVLAFDGVHLVGHTPLWMWITFGVLFCLLWLMMGRFVADLFWPGPIGAVAVLVLWAVLTFLLSTIPLLFFPQELCGGMLKEIFGPLAQGSWIVEKLIPCCLLSAMFGSGLFWGRKRAAAACHGGESESCPG